MMKSYRWFLLVAAGLALFAGGACANQNAAPTVDINAAVQTALAATRAIDMQVAQAVQATLQAVTPAPLPPADTPTAAPTDTPLPAPANTVAPPPAATSTPVPAPTKPPTAAPTPTRIRIAESDVDSGGNDFLRGSSSSNQGRVVLLPGLDQAEVGFPPTFTDFINLRVEVFDTRAGLADGDGIESVTYRIFDDNGDGDLVWEKRETNHAYCLFGSDEPTCQPLDLRASQAWPDGTPITNGAYLARIEIVPVEGDTAEWRWNFAVESPYLSDSAVWRGQHGPHRRYRCTRWALHRGFRDLRLYAGVAGAARALFLQHGAARSGRHAGQRTMAALSRRPEPA